MPRKIGDLDFRVAINVLSLISGEEVNFTDIVRRSGLSGRTVNRVLRILTEKGVVSKRKQWRHRFYHAEPSKVFQYFDGRCAFKERFHVIVMGTKPLFLEKPFVFEARELKKSIRQYRQYIKAVTFSSRWIHSMLSELATLKELITVSEFFAEHDIEAKELDALFLKHEGYSFLHDLDLGEAYLYLRQYVDHPSGVKIGLEKSMPLKTALQWAPTLTWIKKEEEQKQVPALLRRRRTIRPTWQRASEKT